MQLLEITYIRLVRLGALEVAPRELSGKRVLRSKLKERDRSSYKIERHWVTCFWGLVCDGKGPYGASPHGPWAPQHICLVEVESEVG